MNRKNLRLSLAAFGVLVITLSTTTPVVAGSNTCLGHAATIIGTAGDDRGGALRGTQGADVIVGLAGNDEIYGLGGNDFLCGSGGADSISGGDGDDRISGGPGNDALSGGNGGDSIKGGDGVDTASGGTGNDNLKLQDLHSGDVADGGSDRDTCSADSTDTVKPSCEIKHIRRRVTGSTAPPAG